jgi:hypothetical protein
MAVQNLPKTGDKLFLMHHEVVVTKVYAIFRLIKIRYTEETLEFFVDVCAVTAAPSYMNSISIEMLRRNRGEQYHVFS